MEATKQLDLEQKKTLLKRKFTSEEYFVEFRDHFAAALEGLRGAIAHFEAHPPEGVDWRSWHVSDRPEEWERRAVPNFERLLWSIEEGIENYLNGDPTRLEGTTGSIRGLSRQMDVLGWKWWDYVGGEYAGAYFNNMGVANTHAATIYYTLSDYWGEDDEDLLVEEVTGPVDEADLLRYLEEGEQPRWQ